MTCQQKIYNKKGHKKYDKTAETIFLESRNYTFQLGKCIIRLLPIRS